MSDDLSNKIKQIAELLSQNGMPENLKGLISSLTTSTNQEEPAPASNQLPVPGTERKERSEAEENFDMIRKVKKVMDTLNTRDDPRINLLTAIQPFLNSRRQKKLSSCIRILQMSRLGSIIDDKK